MTEIAATFDGLVLRGELLNLPAAGKDQDASLVEDGFVGIADGSTPLLEGAEIDARGYARGALERLSRHRAAPPWEMFRRALEEGTPATEPVSRRPSATVVTLTAGAGELLVSVLGDCLGVVRTLDGAVTVATDSRLERFDRPVAAQMARDVSAGMSIEQARDAASGQLLANRDRANQIGAYWLFSDDATAGEQIETATVSLSNFASLLLCTDGFSRLIEPFGIAADAEGLLSLAERRGLERLGEELRSAEAGRESFARFPRLDPSDDATAILLRRD